MHRDSRAPTPHHARALIRPSNGPSAPRYRSRSFRATIGSPRGWSGGGLTLQGCQVCRFTDVLSV